jgi:RNA polymerase sigma-70 factor (ECF subfamily)
MLELTYPAVPVAEEPRGLVARLRAGEPAALGEAYDLYHVHVRVFARQLIGDNALAEDVVQETFAALPRAIRGYLGGGALRTFLVGIAINHARHHVRSAARRRAAVERLASEPAPTSVSPEANVQHVQLAEALHRALDELSIEQRTAFVLCELEEQSSIEAALVLNVPEATVRTRLLQARRKLRAWFKRRGMR